MKQSEIHFMEKIDELVEYSTYNSKLAESIKWVDVESRKKGISFYELFYEIFSEYDVSIKAKEWLKTKS